MPTGSPRNSIPIALTIAGFDPSGGAGVLADAKTFAAFGCRPTAAITSLTFQNTRGVFGAAHQTGQAVRAQVMPLLEDFPVACAKTGVLPTSGVIIEVARLFRETKLPRPVVDPVMKSTSGYDLMEDDAIYFLIRDLLPLASVVTPNIAEAERLAGIAITSEEDMRRAATMICKMGARATLVKGGHLSQQDAESRLQDPGAASHQAVDVLDDGGKITMFRMERIPGADLHGSGCVLSAAIAAGLGKGMALEDSVRAAKRFVWETIRTAPPVGCGV